ncbi:MAG: hypothetical protein AB8B83_01080 [Bdellovibrionales bacterium]
MESFASSSGGVMFVETAIVRETNKQAKAKKHKAISYKDLDESDGQKPSIREKIFGIFVKQIKTINTKAA